jgi:hypothetical protein
MFDKSAFYSKQRKDLFYESRAVFPLLEESASFINKSGYRCLIREDNEELFNALEDLGFFEFHCTNVKKQIIGYHQAVLYLYNGWKILRYNSQKCAQGKLEVHHFDSNRLNNNIENLWYVTPQQNCLCSSVVNKKYLGHKHLRSANLVRWGKATGNELSTTAALIQKTYVRTMKAMGFTLSQIPSVANILLQCPRDLGKKLVRHWQFTFNNKGLTHNAQAVAA